MKISIISFLFIAISSTTFVGALNAATKSNLRRGLNAAQRSLQDEYTYKESTFCQLNFCEDFYTSCRVTANPLSKSVPYMVSSAADYCRVTLTTGVEITCTQECDVAMDDDPESRAGGDDSLPTGQFQIKRKDISDENLCLELEGNNYWSNVFQTDCDDTKQTQQWVLVEKLNGQNMPVFTLSPAQDTGLCLDMDRSMDDLQLYDCKDSSAYTANQEFDTQFFNDSGGKLFIDERCVYVGENAGRPDRILGDKDKDKNQCASSSDIPQFIFE